MTLTPRFPNPPLSPNAPPWRAFGKKKLMLAMLEAKLAPAKPHSREMMTNTLYGVLLSCTANPSHKHGTSRKQVLMAVQRRPPNSGITNEYGTRKIAPDTDGSAVRRNSWSVVKLKPTLFRLTATALNSIQTQKASSRQGMEIHRLRVAMRWPRCCQKALSSGRQS